ncbi:MAG: DUF58 domain-containing protein [Chloroflexi bacterium]|nr:DUF58 domain-containing protein [Chloroflexota bacterium]
MPLKSWVPFLALMFVLGAVFQLPLLVILPVALGVILAAASWWERHALDGVIYRRRFHYNRGFPGETTSVKVEIENRKLLPVSWLRTEDPWPKAVGPEDLSLLAPSHIPDEGYLTHIFSLRWFERTSRSYTLSFRNRGYYRIGPVQLSSGDLFGMYEQRQQAGAREALTVFPELLPFSEFKLLADDPFGDRQAHRRLFEDPNRQMGVREYQPEDEFRRIHWPATAHTGELQSKIYQPVTSQVMFVCLNVATFPHYWEGIYPPLLEHLIKMAATLVYQGMRTGYAVGLLSNGCLARADQPFRMLPGRSPKQLVRLLQALAEVTPFITAPFEKLLLKSMSEIPYGATVVIVTALVPPELSETLGRLRKYRKHMTLISLEAKAPPPIPGVRTVHLPFKPESK